MTIEHWILLIIGTIITAFFALGITVFIKVERRIEWWFVIGLIIGIVILIFGMNIIERI